MGCGEREGEGADGGGSPGWQTDRAAREPPKLDYSCRAALNGITHVRDDRPVASRGRTPERVPLGSVPIAEAGERRDASRSRGSFDLIEASLIAPALSSETIVEAMKFPDGLYL